MALTPVEVQFLTRLKDQGVSKEDAIRRLEAVRQTRSQPVEAKPVTSQTIEGLTGGERAALEATEAFQAGGLKGIGTGILKTGEAAFRGAGEVLSKPLLSFAAKRGIASVEGLSEEEQKNLLEEFKQSPEFTEQVSRTGGGLATAATIPAAGVAGTALRGTQAAQGLMQAGRLGRAAVGTAEGLAGGAIAETATQGEIGLETAAGGLLGGALGALLPDAAKVATKLTEVKQKAGIDPTIQRVINEPVALKQDIAEAIAKGDDLTRSGLTVDEAQAALVDAVAKQPAKAQRLQEHIEAVKQANVNLGAKSPTALALEKVDEALNKIREVRKTAGEAKQAVLSRIGQTKVAPTTVVDDVAGEIAASTGLRLAQTGKNKGKLVAAPGREVRLSNAEVSEIQDIVNSIRRIPQQTIQFADDVKGKINNAIKYDMGIQVDTPFNRLLKRLASQVDDVITKSGGDELKEANKQFSEIANLDKRVVDLIGKQGQRSEFALNKALSERGTAAKELFDEILEKTGVDLMDEAVFSRFVIDNFANAAQKSRFEQGISKGVEMAADIKTGGIASIARRLLEKLAPGADVEKEAIELANRMDTLPSNMVRRITEYLTGRSLTEQQAKTLKDFIDFITKPATIGETGAAVPVLEEITNP